MCFRVSSRDCVFARLKVCVFKRACWGGNGLICLCILTVFIRAAAAALMRNTFGLILLPHATETGGGGLRNTSSAYSAHTWNKHLHWPFPIVINCTPSS